MARAPVQGTLYNSYGVNGLATASFGEKGEMGLPLAMGACADPSLLPPLGIVVLLAVVVEDLAFPFCGAILVCLGIRPEATAGLGNVDVVVFCGLSDGPTLAENEGVGLGRGGDGLAEVEAVKRKTPAAAAAVAA